MSSRRIATAEPSRSLALRRKRAFDLIVGSAAMVLLAPLLGPVGILIGVTDGRPILFRQVRIGLDGRPSRLIKFRTMERGAADRLDDLMARNELDLDDIERRSMRLDLEILVRTIPATFKGR